MPNKKKRSKLVTVSVCTRTTLLTVPWITASETYPPWSPSQGVTLAFHLCFLSRILHDTVTQSQEGTESPQLVTIIVSSSSASSSSPRSPPIPPPPSPSSSSSSFCLFVCCCCLEMTESHVTNAGLQLAIQPVLALNSELYHLYLSCASITGMCRHPGSVGLLLYWHMTGCLAHLASCAGRSPHHLYRSTPVLALMTLWLQK